MEKHGYHKKTRTSGKIRFYRTSGRIFPMGWPYFSTWMDPSLVSADAGPVAPTAKEFRLPKEALRKLNQALGGVIGACLKTSE